MHIGNNESQVRLPKRRGCRGEIYGQDYKKNPQIFYDIYILYRYNAGCVSRRRYFCSITALVQKINF